MADYTLGQCECLTQFAKEQLLALIYISGIDHGNMIGRMTAIVKGSEGKYTEDSLRKAIEAADKQREPLLELKKAIEGTKVCPEIAVTGFRSQASYPEV